jgi:hypothetical protein
MSAFNELQTFFQGIFHAGREQQVYVVRRDNEFMDQEFLLFTVFVHGLDEQLRR